MLKDNNKRGYCARCGKICDYNIKKEDRVKYVGKEKITYIALVARCVKCDSEIWEPCLCRENLNRLQSTYENNKIKNEA